MSGDRGSAAIEMALVTTLLTALLALVAPLAGLCHQRVQLGQAVGEGPLRDEPVRRAA